MNHVWLDRPSWVFMLVALVGFTTACGEGDQTPPPTESAEPAGPDGLSGWQRPRSSERRAQRRAMVERQIAARGVRDRAVLDALTRVPRHWFVPDSIQAAAYNDRPLPIGEGQTISQPYIVALMTEALDLTRDSKVLEIGTGSGYQAAVLAEITPHVFTIEIVEPLGRRAIKVFKNRGYTTIQARIGDGYAGWLEHAPFDAVIVTCAPDHIPPKLVEQLKPGGRLCIPVGDQGRIQKLVLVKKSEEGKLTSTNLIPVRFVPMTGQAQSKPREAPKKEP